MVAPNYIVRNVDETGSDTTALLLAKLDLVITGLSNIEIDAESVDLNTDQLETLVAATTTAVNTLKTTLIGSGSKDLTTLTTQVDLITTAVNALKTAFELTQAVEGANAPANTLSTGAMAASAAPAARTAGKLGRLLTNLSAGLVLAGYDWTDDVLDVSESNPFANQASTPTMLNGVTVATTSSAEGVSGYARKTIRVVVTSNTGAVTVTITESDVVGMTNPGTLWTKTYTATNAVDVIELNGHYNFIQIATSTQSNSTVSAILMERGQ